jgi:hypothetical protein
MPIRCLSQPCRSDKDFPLAELSGLMADCDIFQAVHAAQLHMFIR